MAETRGELGERIALLVLRHSPADIQRMKRNFATKIRDLAPDYRDRLTRKITEHLLGTYQRIRLMHQQGIFRAMQEPVQKSRRSTGTWWRNSAGTMTGEMPRQSGS